MLRLRLRELSQVVNHTMQNTLYRRQILLGSASSRQDCAEADCRVQKQVYRARYS
jgi:hypothetical protein